MIIYKCTKYIWFLQKSLWEYKRRRVFSKQQQHCKSNFSLPNNVIIIIRTDWIFNIIIITEPPLFSTRGCCQRGYCWLSSLSLLKSQWFQLKSLCDTLPAPKYRGLYPSILQINVYANSPEWRRRRKEEEGRKKEEENGKTKEEGEGKSFELILKL